MPFSLARQPLAPSLHRPHSVSDSLPDFSVSVSFFVPLAGLFFGHPLSHRSLQIHREDERKLGTGMSRSKLLILWERGELSI